MTICDAHCHFFSSGFFRTLAKEHPCEGDPAIALPVELGWDPPGDDGALADRWVLELDRYQVTQAMLIASVPGDEASVAAASARHPGRIRGAFMFNPLAPDADARLEHALGPLGLRMVCLFPAMHHVRLDDPAVAPVFAAAERHRATVFVHCGLLTVGARKKLGLPSRFDLSLGNPLAVATVAARYPAVPVVIPHFGGGLLREALIAAEAASNIRLDTSSSNNWVRFQPGLTLRDVFARALDVLGPSRLIFGTDSSSFPRGWQKGIYEAQREILDSLGVSSDAQASVFGGNLLAL